MGAVDLNIPRLTAKSVSRSASLWPSLQRELIAVTIV